MSMTPGQYPGEQQNETWRLLVVVALVTVMFLAWPYVSRFLGVPESQPQTADGGVATGPADPTALADGTGSPATTPSIASTPGAASAPGAAAAAPGATSAPALAAPAVAKQPEAFVEQQLALADVRLSTWGAGVSEFKLRTYQDVSKREEGKKPPPVDLVPGKGIDDKSFSIRAIDGTFPLAVDAVYEVVEEVKDRVVMRHDTGRGVTVTRTFKFEEEKYAFDVLTRLENKTDAVQSVTLEMAVTGRERPGERESSGMFMPPMDQTGWACRTDELHQELSSKHEQDTTLSGAVKWAAINRQYFLAALIPRQGQTTACAARRTVNNGLRVSVDFAPMTIPGGQSVEIITTGYFGPKQMGQLQELEASVDEAIDFGWFGLIARPLLKLLVFFYEHVVSNYGLAILLLTLMVKLVLLPITQKSFESAERMKKIQPLLKELQAKYKSDRMMASQKQMELFKEHKVSPFGGCLPLLLQMPIWIALYRTLWSSVELYQQPFIAGWIDNLAAKDPTYVLPIAVGVVMLVQQIFTPMPQDNPSMKYVMWGMPIFFTFIMISLPAGLALYILCNSVLTIFQQMYIRRKFASKQPAK